MNGLWPWASNGDEESYQCTWTDVIAQTPGAFYILSRCFADLVLDFVLNAPTANLATRFIELDCLKASTKSVSDR